MAAKGSWREQLFDRLGEWGTERPWVVLGVVLLGVLSFAAALPGLAVSTSRTNMVSDDDPQQARMNAFHERFGRPDYPLFVVSGGEAADRRAVVDAMTQTLSEDEALAGRVFARVLPQDMSSVLLLHQPDALGQIAARLPPTVQAATFLEGGVAGWLEGLRAQLEVGLEGGLEGGAQAAGADPKEAAEGIAQLATVAGALEDVVTGRDVMTRFEAQLEDAPRQPGIDERGYIVTADGEHHLVAIYADMPSDEGRALRPLVAQLRAARDEALAAAPAGVEARLTGLPALSVDELGHVEQGLLVTSIAATIGIFGICLVLFRSIRQTIVALLPLGPGIVVTLAVVRLLYDDLNIITSGFVAVLLGLGIDFSVHVIARRNEEVRAGKDSRAAVRAALRHTGPSVFTGAVVTAAAFLTNMTTEFTAFGELGAVTSAGLLLMVVITLAVIPPLLTIGKPPKSPRLPPEPPGLSRLPGAVRRGKALLVGAAVALAAVGGVTIPKLEYNPRYFDFLPESTESAQGLNLLEYDALASPVFAAFTADDVESARTKAAALRALPSVAGVQTPSDLLPPLDDEALQTLRAGLAAFGAAPNWERMAAAPVEATALSKTAEEIADLLEEVRFAMRGAELDTAPADQAHDAFRSLAKTLAGLDEAGAQRLAAINPQAAALLQPALSTAAAVAQRGHYVPGDVPALFARRFLSKDGEALSLFAVPAGAFWEEAVALEFAAEVRTVDEGAVGLAMVHVEHGRQVREGFERAALYAAGIIVVLLLLDFRSLRDTLLALLPTAVGWLWMLALMPVVGLDFNVANIVALPLVLGIGIAFGVHMMHRLRESPPEDGTPSLEAVVVGTGGAIAVAATTTMAGFAALMLSAYGGMVSLGATMVLGIAACLVATLLVLPAVLLLTGRAR